MWMQVDDGRPDPEGVITTTAGADAIDAVVVTGPVPPPAPPVAKAAAADAVAVVLDHPGPFLVLPPVLPVAVRFWPLVRVDLPADEAAVLLDPETHKALGAMWREWQESDEPTAEIAAAMARHTRMARERRRCCGK